MLPDDPAKVPRPVSKVTFWATVGLAQFVLATLVASATAVAARRLGLPALRDLRPALILPSSVIAILLVDRFYKSLGRSWSGWTVEGRRPSALPHVEPLRPDEVVEVRYSRSFSNRMAGIGLGLGVFCLLVFLCEPREDPRASRIGLLSAAAFLAAAALMFALRYLVLVRADSRGVWSCWRGLSLRMTLVPWDEIASCEVVTTRDFAGKIVLAYPLLRDHRGRELFQGLGLGLLFASPQDRARLLCLMKDRFPKPDEAWEPELA